MVDLAIENRLQASTAGIEEVFYTFPSFSALRQEIEVLQKRKARSEDPNFAKVITEERLRFFERNCTRVEGLRVRAPEDADEETRKQGLDLPEADSDWKARIPAQVKIATVAFFDELRPNAARVLPAEFFGDPTVVELQTGFGPVRFHFDPQDTPGFQRAIKKLMQDRVRPQGRQIRDSSLQAQRAFLADQCRRVEGACNGSPDEIKPGAIPANWMVTLCGVFENQEALSEAEVGE